MAELAPSLAMFLREYLPRDRGTSRHTVESYALCFKLLVVFAADKHGIRPCKLKIGHLDIATILEFLEHLERNGEAFPLQVEGAADADDTGADDDCVAALAHRPVKRCRRSSTQTRTSSYRSSEIRARGSRNAAPPPPDDPPLPAAGAPPAFRFRLATTASAPE